MWNPEKYLDFADHRGRPFFDLVGRVGAEAPRRVVDLGCGPGNLTVHLSQRWPDAVVQGVDSSQEMVAAARARGVDAREGDVRTWSPEPDTDVVVTNAALQWVPEHKDLLVRWADELPRGAWLAMRVPGNFTSPAHEAIRTVARRASFVNPLRDMPLRDGLWVDSAPAYAAMLMDRGCRVDAWETTYIHELTGENPILEWISGTALTPVIERLSPQSLAQFRQQMIPLLDESYPKRADGTTFYPFRRIFVVAQVT